MAITNKGVSTCTKNKFNNFKNRKDGDDLSHEGF